MRTFQLDALRHSPVYSWLLYAVSAAGLGGLLAFAVAMTRTPGVRLLPSARAFQVILVGHVTYTLTIWLLAFVTAIWAHAAAQAGLPLNRQVHRIALAISLIGTALLTLPVVLFQGQDVMTDYVPLLNTPLFFVGFVTFLAGIGIAAVNYLVAAARHPPLPVVAYGMACAAVAMLAGLAALGAAALRLGLGANGRAPAEYYQAMFWGMGHSFQYVNVASMTATWFMLVCVFAGPPNVNPRLAKGLFTLFAVFPLATPVPYFLYDPISVPTQKAWGIALDVGLSLPVILVGPMILIWAWRAWAARRLKSSVGTGKPLRRVHAAAALQRTSPVSAAKFWRPGVPWSDPRLTTFVFSAALFVFGLSIHPAARQGTLRTPAHYHSLLVGGITLAFMGLAYHLLRTLNREVLWRRAAALQPYVFALGLFLLVGGLLGAGDLGAPRKTYDATVTGAAWLGPMVFMGLGAVIAVLGGAMFVVNLLLSLLRPAAAACAVPVGRAAHAGESAPAAGGAFDLISSAPRR